MCCVALLPLIPKAYKYSWVRSGVMHQRLFAVHTVSGVAQLSSQRTVANDEQQAARRERLWVRR